MKGRSEFYSRPFFVLMCSPHIKGVFYVKKTKSQKIRQNAEKKHIFGIWHIDKKMCIDTECEM